METKLTRIYTLENWEQATKGWMFSAWPEEAQESTITLFSGAMPEEPLPYRRSDFECALQKVSRRIKK